MKRLLLSLALLSFALAPTSWAAAVTVSSINPTGEARLLVTSTSANVALSVTGTPTVARVTNLGQATAFVLMGTTSGVVATPATGLVVLPGQTVYLTLGSNTFIAGITTSSTTALAVDLGN